MAFDADVVYLLGIFLAVAQIFGVIAAVHAILTVRTAQGALAWSISLLFMPLLTLLPYLILGRSKFDAYIQARRQADVEMHLLTETLDLQAYRQEVMTARHTDDYGNLQALSALGGYPSLINNKVQLLINGQQTFDAIFDAIRQARKVILVQFFIIHNDDLGRQLQKLLLERAAAGVSVYMLYDRIGSHGLPSRYAAKLRKGGVQVCTFATRRGFFNRFQINFRCHRKIVVVDGRIGFVGGHNVGDEYLGKKPPLSPWRDTHISLEGPVVNCLQECFAEDWYWASHSLPQIVLPVCYPETGALCQVVATGPADAQEGGSLFFVEMIHAARQRIWITTPYFVPDESVYAALVLAVLRGIDVRLIIPENADHLLVHAATSLYASEAVRDGIRVFRYQPGFMHQKVVLADADTAAIGSTNLDNRSFRLNFEVMAVVVDIPFARQVEAMLLDDLNQCQEQRISDSQHSTRLHELEMRVARLVSPIL